MENLRRRSWRKMEDSTYRSHGMRMKRGCFEAAYHDFRNREQLSTEQTIVSLGVMFDAARGMWDLVTRHIADPGDFPSRRPILVHLPL